jgi:hypothetical protein
MDGDMKRNQGAPSFAALDARLKKLRANMDADLEKMSVDQLLVYIDIKTADLRRREISSRLGIPHVYKETPSETKITSLYRARLRSRNRSKN